MMTHRASPLLFHKLETPIFALLILAILLSGRLRAASGIWSLLFTICFWGWSTLVWASDVEILEQKMLSVDLPLSRSFWLAFIPHLILAVIAMLIAPRRFFSFGFSGNDGNRHGESGAWYTAGQGFFYGQVLTNAALSACSPVVTFVVRAVEPMIIANLAIVSLGKKSTLQQLFPIFLSCGGVMLAVLGCDAHQPKDLNKIEVGCLLAMASNVAFAARSCSIKYAFTTEGEQTCPMEVFVKLAKTSFIASGIPVALYFVVFSGDDTGGELARLVTSISECWLPMLNMSLCYAVQTAASFLILEAVSVETHSLLSSLKQVLLALLESVFLGEVLSNRTLVGVLVTMAGLTMYSSAPMKLESKVSQYSLGPTEPVETDDLLPSSGKKAKTRGSFLVPKSLIFCCVAVALSGVRCSFGEVGSFKAPAVFKPGDGSIMLATSVTVGDGNKSTPEHFFNPVLTSDADHSKHLLSLSSSPKRSSVSPIRYRPHQKLVRAVSLVGTGMTPSVGE
jgi:uncharacterized membrane protein